MELVSNSRWISALRSSKYTQGQFLVDERKRTLCAFAVLAVESGYLILDDNFAIVKYEQEAFATAAVKALGAKMIGVILCANDDGSKSFDQIATMIEELV